jgi:hypothetical protein
MQNVQFLNNKNTNSGCLFFETPSFWFKIVLLSGLSWLTTKKTSCCFQRIGVQVPKKRVKDLWSRHLMKKRRKENYLEEPPFDISYPQIEDSCSSHLSGKNTNSCFLLMNLVLIKNIWAI